ncbi:MAG: patatin-like phospholipase family protein [Betaproteobacteria bacterium]|nr:MAG: patatin-like phospholipase family protein [Betaproteobacteria bacterium]
MGDGGGRAALVLTGGGARAAYQVGVLSAIREIRGRRPGNPFPILCGTSAGGINAVALAVHSANFDRAVRHVARIWRNFHIDQVYRVDPVALFGSGLRWASATFTGWAIHQTPHSLLDNSPLRTLLTRVLDYSAIDRAIKAGYLQAISVTASGYASGESLAFFEGSIDIQPWRRAHRMGVRTQLGVDHLMATSALPLVFPAVRINREFFGDGSMRQLAPVSPAIHLGADRVLVIGAGRIAEEGRQRAEGYPSPAQIAGHALSSIFLDTLAVDLERLERINQIVGTMTPQQRRTMAAGLRPVETLVISPSQRIDTIAARHRQEVPSLLSAVLRGVGAMRRDGSTLLSYLLFEPGFIRALMELGYADAMARRSEVAAFLRL